ncbi:MAG: ATPase [Bacteroidetes bacterium]|nr:ATPase [Bacteroidota bacterium]
MQIFPYLRQSSARFEEISRRINTAMFVLVATVLVSLILEYGFYFPASVERMFEFVDVAVLFCFIVAQSVKFLLAPHRWEYVRERNFEYALTLLLMLSLIALAIIPEFFTGIARQWHLHGLSALFVLIAQIVIVLNLISTAVRFSRRITRLQIQPARLFIGSFVFVILLGTLGLLLPRATTGGIGFLDALFTSTSAVCVTGLIVVDTASAFTPLGKVIITLLIQIGGLGLMTFTTFFTLFSGRLSIKERVLMQDFLSRESLGEVRRTLWQIVSVTLIIEAIGAVLLYFSWDSAAFPSTREKVFSSIFHSVSAFCNAGFSLFSDNLAGPAAAMNMQVNLTVAGLIILGGLGFITIVNVVSIRPWARAQSRLSHRLTAHSRVVLISSAVLLAAGMLLFYLIEYNNTLAGLNWWEKLLASFFQSVTTRTAGFNTIDIGAMAVPSTLLFLVLMFIGASPGSTGGGVKTTTVSLVFLSAINHVRGKSSIEIGNRRILQSNVDRAAAALFFSLVLVGLSVFFVSFFEPFPLLDVVFECFSAMGTVGLSRGITFALSDPSKIVLILTMLIGRVGALTLMMALTRRAALNRFDYPTEQIVVG